MYGYSAPANVENIIKRCANSIKCVKTLYCRGNGFFATDKLIIRAAGPGEGFLRGTQILSLGTYAL